MAFFRSPKRITYPSCDDILAPADGKVVVIEKTIETEYFKKEMIQISIFMSLFNVHANWIPFAGKVKYVNHQKGNYHAAYLPKASTENERTSTVIECKHNGEEGLVRQIAGAIARRIITYPKVGDEVTINGQLGFIKFGSRVDLFLPADKVEIYAEYGDKTRANQTILAKWK